MIRDALPDRLTPLAASLGLAPLYGDVHNHCNLSYGHGDLEDALARAELQLDFVSVTGHADWPDMPKDEPGIAHIMAFHVEGFAKLKANWLGHFDTLRAHERQGVFSVFPGYEIHSCAHGDYTIIYADLDPAEIELAQCPEALRCALAQSKADRALAFPHHIGYRQGARGINWNTFDPALSPFVEIFSMHGCAETSEGERTYLHSMGPTDGRSTMAAGLAHGHVFGVVANTDHHSGFPGSYGHGRTGLYAESHSRDAIWEAMRGRRTNALTGDNIHLLTAIDDVVQGRIIAPQSDAVLAIEAVGGGFIDTIDVIRNGHLDCRISPELSPAPINADDGGTCETILYVELGWGARGHAHRWAGTVRLEAGEILAVEPRFRGAEVVSPLEGDESKHALPEITRDADGVSFDVTAEANPNNATPATQGFALRMRVRDETMIRAELSGTSIAIPAKRLFEGALAGNLGPIDSPAYRFHALPRPRQWQWQGRVELGRIDDGENIYVRLRQLGGQTAWASPIFCRNDQKAN